MITERALLPNLEVEAQITTSTSYPTTVAFSTGFEGSNIGWSAGTTAASPTTTSTTTTTNSPRTGTYNQGLVAFPATPSGTVINAGQFWMAYTLTGLLVGHPYTVSVWVYMPGSAGFAMTNAKVGIQGIGYGTAATNADVWSERTYTFTATATSHVLRVEATYPGATGVTAGTGRSILRIDDVTVTRNAWTNTISTWTPLLADATSMSIRRGGARDGLGIKTDVGLCTFKLLDAADTDDLDVGLPVRVMVGPSGDRDPIFTGRIAWTNEVPQLNKQTNVTRTRTEVTVADAVQIHMSTMRYGIDLGLDTNETFEERIERLEASANAPVDVPVVGAPLEVYSF